jgi:pullulanase
MEKALIQATAKSNNVIEVYVSKDFCFSELKVFRLYENGKLVQKIKPVSMSESTSSYIYTLLLKEYQYTPGFTYELATEHNYFVSIDISFIATTKEFEEKYRYDGKLGAIYSKNSTVFRVFSPFATQIVLNLIRKDSHEIECFNMNHNLKNGIYETTIPGDLDEASYTYSATVFGNTKEVVDPYAYGLNSNSRKGFVINPDRVKEIKTNSDQLPEFKDYQKAVIYECDVRDMTSLTSVPDKGTYKALSQEGLKEKNIPVGLDYLASLGVSHIQLQPILDFQTIDDDHPFDSYNWGYDPSFFFAPEGSYSLNPNDPYSRVVELRNLIASFHAKGLRVNIDVVYNHVFSADFNSLAILVPQYYFRLNGDKTLSNGSGCGNDFESCHYMARKLIIDSLLHLLDFYDVDGFRFDLMGIIDTDTLKLAFDEVKKVKADIMFYGEGWDLWTNLPADKKGSYFNADKMPYCAFFNDRFRDVVKGKSNASELLVKGYLSGDTNYLDGFKHVLLGSSVALAFAPLFKSPTQSVNYVECHDNNTLYDKLLACCPEDKPDEILKRIKMCNMAVLLACGIPFFHEGQEIGHSKGGIANSYNSSDKVNGFDYSLVEKRKSLYEFFKDAVEFTKRFYTLANGEFDTLSTHITFDNLPEGAVKINYNFTDFTVFVIFNPSKKSFVYSFNDYVNLVFNESGNVEKSDFYIRMAIINALSVNIFTARKGKDSKKQ